MSTEPDFEVIESLDEKDLHLFGYTPKLRRAMGPLASFAVAFSMISVTNAIFFLFPGVFETTGGIGIWLWFPVAAGLMLIVLVYSHLGSRIPVTGYAYQWNSRLVGPNYGWFTGWTAMLAFFSGTASIGVSIATVFAPEIWAEPSKSEIVLFAGVVIGVAMLLNIISIKATAFVNNIGVSLEVAASLIAAAIVLVGAIFFFEHSEGFGVLTQKGPVGGGHVGLEAIGLAALLPVYTLLGWEGAADLAEETKDPRRATPKAMIRANYTSVAASLLLIVSFAIAIPHGVGAMLGQPQNPLLYIFETQVGHAAASVLKVVVFLAIFSCLLANMAVGTRMCYSLSRDRMLPGSKLLAHVPQATRTPVYSVALVAIVAFGVNLLSEGIALRVVAIVTICYYGTYALTVIAAIIADRRGNIPDTVPGGFSLGRWLRPVAIAALLWAIVILVDLTVPSSNNVAAEYTAGAEVLGVAWWLFYLRPRLKDGRVGVARGETLKQAEMARVPELAED
ncbi:MAG: amino acid permease [Actinobacteria bacterium]|nr:amino acid permease [Actinomycetota bacterium]